MAFVIYVIFFFRMNQNVVIQRSAFIVNVNRLISLFVSVFFSNVRTQLFAISFGLIINIFYFKAIIAFCPHFGIISSNYCSIITPIHGISTHCPKSINSGIFVNSRSMHFAPAARFAAVLLEAGEEEKKNLAYVYACVMSANVVWAGFTQYIIFFYT